MKTKDKIKPFSLIALWIVGFVIWGAVLSDFKFSLKNITVNDLVTYGFFLIFLVIIIFATIKLHEIISITVDFKNATNKLNEMNENGRMDFSDLKDSFTNSSLKSIYKKYVQETDRLQRDLPGGVGCDIEEFFNEDNLAAYIHDDKLNQYPGTFTGIGMLGTFVGLTIGLSQFNFLGTSDGLAENINPLMSSIKVAFITSILGLVFSIVFNSIFRNSTEKLNASITAFVNAHHTVAKDDSHNQINKLIQVQETQKDLLKSFPNSIIHEIAGQLAPLIREMENTYEKACDSLKDAQIQGMETLMTEFNKRLIGTLNKTAKDLTESIRETRDYQFKTTEILEKDINAVIALTDKSVEISCLSEKAILNLKDYTELLDKNIKELLGDVTTNTNAVNNSIKEYKNIYSKHIELLEDSTNSLKTISDTNLECIRSVEATVLKVAESSERFAESYSISNNKIAESISSLNDLEKHIENSLNISVGNILNNVEENESPLVENISEKINNSMKETSENICGEINNSVKEASDKFNKSLNNTVKNNINKLDNFTADRQKAIEDASTKMNKSVVKAFENTFNKINNKMQDSAEPKKSAKSTKNDDDKQ